ncbi:MAG TPA: hypothetical protein VN802_15765 [Stellaceae bacterium]|nr:hypothetical protein [Stellaceae bacterium]
MRASRTESAPRPISLGALIAAAVTAALPAAAQLGPPVSLVPRPSASRPAAPAPAQAPASPKVAAPRGIEAQPLSPTDAAWAGTLGEDQGAFPVNMWRGTQRSLVASALPLLQPSSSPALQDLARRLLLSNAVSPAGPDAPDRPSLAASRLERLMALGDVQGALAMMDSLPADPKGDGMDRMRVELRFAANDAKGACQSVADGIAHYKNAWWDRALVACQALAGDGAKAALGLSLLKEQKAPADAAFDALIDALGGRPRKIDKLADASPMRVALLAAAKQPLPAEVLAAAGPASLLAYASSESVPAERRLAAAERAALLGALAPDALGALYRQIQFKPEEQTAALAEGKLPQDAKSRAILYDIARSGASTQTREAAIAALFAEAKKRGAFPLAARLIAPALSEFNPADGSSAFAADAARALLVTGAADAAPAWIDSADSRALAMLSSLALPSGGEGQDAASLLHDTIAELASRNAGAAPAQADLLVALAGALDQPIGALDWSPLMAPPHDAKMPSTALWLDQQQAMTAKRVGETALTSILLVGAGEQLSLEPILLARAIAGLRAIGCESDARALALEAAIDAGI